MSQAVSLSRQPDVRADMNRVRRNLAKRNPRGYSAPLRCVVGGEEVTVDLLPLYFVSQPLRDELGDLPERPAGVAVVRFDGDIPMTAFKFFLAYADGSGRGQNWAADLDEEVRMAAYVWELAVVYKVEALERLVRSAAFNVYGGMWWETAPRLFLRARGRDDKSMRIAFQYMTCNLQSCCASPYFAYLSFGDVRRVLNSKYLRATQRERFDAMNTWLHGNPKEPWPEREADFHELVGTLHFPLTRDTIVLGYEGYVMREQVDPLLQLKPVAACDEKRKGRYSFVAFQLNPPRDKNGYYGLLEMAKKRGALHDPGFDQEPPKFRGQFAAFNYYWELECEWCHRTDPEGAGMSCFLRLLHGSDMAGVRVQGEVVGLQTAFKFMVHCSDDWSKCYKQSEPFDLDMLNLPGKRSKYGYRKFLDKDDCRKFLKRPPNLHVSIEMRRVREVTKKEY